MGAIEVQDNQRDEEKTDSIHPLDETSKCNIPVAGRIRVLDNDAAGDSVRKNATIAPQNIRLTASSEYSLCGSFRHRNLIYPRIIEIQDRQRDEEKSDAIYPLHETLECNILVAERLRLDSARKNATIASRNTRQTASCEYNRLCGSYRRRNLSYTAI